MSALPAQEAEVAKAIEVAVATVNLVPVGIVVPDDRLVPPGEVVPDELFNDDRNRSVVGRRCIAVANPRLEPAAVAEVEPRRRAVMPPGKVRTLDIVETTEVEASVIVATVRRRVSAPVGVRGMNRMAIGRDPRRSRMIHWRMNNRRSGVHRMRRHVDRRANRQLNWIGFP